MNNKEFKKRVNHFFKVEGIDSLSILDDEPEPFFSKNYCHCCKNQLAGDRYSCNGYNSKTKEIQENYEVCQDCIQYIYNNILPVKN